MPLIVLGVTGCIGAYKACELLRELQKRDLDVQVVMTSNATRFVSAMTFEALSRRPVFIDAFALGSQNDIQHISLASSAELMVVAPATANIIGKFAHGIADDALSTLYLATTAPVVVAPAMNVEMLRHPAVQENLRVLRTHGVEVIDPGSGYLACGWLGPGRLAELPDIVDVVLKRLARRREMERERVVVTAGPTVEDIDPVRFLSNRSSGRMGYRLAEAAQDRGARVVLISGPTALPAPAGVEFVAVRTAAEMAHAVRAHAQDATIVAMAAAVSDYRPVAAAAQKIKKDEPRTRLELVQTEDILAGLGQSSTAPLLIGFAAETENLLANARRKRIDKRLDLIVANDVSGSDAGFGSSRNAAVLIDQSGETELGLMSKREMADRIWDRVSALRRRASVA